MGGGARFGHQQTLSARVGDSRPRQPPALAHRPRRDSPHQRRRARRPPHPSPPPPPRPGQTPPEEFPPPGPADHDPRRTQAVLAERSTRSQHFFSTSAGQWDKMRLELFGRRADVALLGLLDESWTVADLGCGTGAIAQSLAPFVERVIAVDESSAMLAAARKRLHGIDNVDIRNGRLESLPLDDAEVDVALLFLVLHYAAEPARVIAEAVRVLKPGARLLVLDMMPHDRQDLRQTMGHLWQGFDRATLGGWMEAAGLDGFRYNELPADPDAKGPSLFAASGKRSGVAARSGSRKKADAVPLIKTA